nr:peptidoglycan DD-metalloendopeptidase family protein [Ktedonobacteraceae bacterium]
TLSLALLLASIMAGSVAVHAVSMVKQGPLTFAAKNKSKAPTPFMHRPYYGSRTMVQRIRSLFDHDKPTYEQDGVFVGYNGTRLTGNDVNNCTPGVNCYDGHNGYDLDMRFEPVLSEGAGTVVRAGWYNPINHNDAFGLWVAIDHKNGFATVYGHLSAITVTVGDQVGVQWQVGTTGTTGSSTGPHLHMGTYYLNDVAWQPTDPFGWGGNYPDPNTVDDNYLWVNNPATNGTVPDLNANGSAIASGAILVDDGDKNWSSTGKWTVDRTKDDINGDLHWTYTSSDATTATATWRPTIPKEGDYEVGVYIDLTYASSSWVPFTVNSARSSNVKAGVSHTVYVDESHVGNFEGPFGTLNTGSQWISIGTYHFKAGNAGSVVMNNATGEAGQEIAADGVEFVPVG